MIKKVTLLAICLLAGAAMKSSAQSSASATQTIHLQINPVIVIGNGNGNGNGQGGGNNGNGNGNGGGIKIKTKTNGNGNGNGNNNAKVAGNNNNNGDNENAANKEFVVRSNKEFMVSIKAEGDNNVYVALADNSTGGNASSKFSTEDYAPLATTSQDLLMNCTRGDDQRFSVNYKASKPAKKTQTITKSDIIYTATLP